MPLELRGLNWGAFFLHWIWGIPNKTYLAFLWFAIGWIMCFVLLFKGNEWAWQNRRFSSVEEFKEIQRQWTIWGIICFVFLELPAIIFFVIVPFIAMIGGMASSF
ncbi:MAG: ribonuclease G [Abditibacteriota bacterium]|nr:ribonuclease G [Abditibacteriota bacterium]